MNSERDTHLWVETYRPKTVQDCILPQDLKSTFQEYVNKKEIPNLMLSGGPGVGKTTIARALCEEIGCDYIMINGSMDGNIDTLRNEIKTFASSVSFVGGTKVVIIDEAHGWMSKTSTEVLHSLGFNFMSAARGGKPHPNDARLLGMTATPFKNIKLVDSSASNEANVKRVVKDETESSITIPCNLLI